MNTATKKSITECENILALVEKKIEAFMDGKAPEKYGQVNMTKEIVLETGISVSLVAPLVGLYVKNDSRVQSKPGRHGGGIHKTGVAWEE